MSDAPSPSSPDSGSSSRTSTGKGRPTPSRREAEAARKAVLKPAMTRKEARLRERERRAQARVAMLDGDERALMPRDQGPVRRAARDYVDGRRNGGELFLPAALLILVLGFVRSLFVQQLSLLLWLVLILVIALDAAVMVRGLKRSLRRRFPDEDLKGIAFYAVMRALQIRRLRVPKAQARPGDTRRAERAARSPRD